MSFLTEQVEIVLRDQNIGVGEVGKRLGFERYGCEWMKKKSKGLLEVQKAVRKWNERHNSGAEREAECWLNVRGQQKPRAFIMSPR